PPPPTNTLSLHDALPIFDFKGGTQLSFKTAAAHTTGDIRTVFGAQGYQDAVIQVRDKSSNGAYKSFQVRTKVLSDAKQKEITSRSEEHTSELQSPYDLVC